MKKALVAAGIAGFGAASFILGAAVVALDTDNYIRSITDLMNNAVKNIIAKANEGILTEDELNELVDTEMEFIKISMKK